MSNFCVVGVIAGVSTTAPTTGGTIDIKKNGVTFATLTFANSATAATGSGTFFTDNSRGIVFDEGDLLTITVNSGFVGGALPKITLSYK